MLGWGMEWAGWLTHRGVCHAVTYSTPDWATHLTGPPNFRISTIPNYYNTKITVKSIKQVNYYRHFLLD